MDDAPSPELAAEFEELLGVLKRNRGFDFTGYKRPSLMRRVRHRMEEVGDTSFAQYVDRLELHAEEFTALFDTVLINLTSFFRDAPAWDQVKQRVIPAIVEAKGEDANIRIWSAGCASGEEVYGLAMLFAEELGEAEFRRRVKIYATDIDEDALATARSATYGERQLRSVPADLRQKYFEPAGSRWAFRRELRRSVICGRNDLTVDAPISRVDLLVCRNTLMYFTAEAQGRILRRFHFALADSGFLFLGKAEMVLSHAELFLPVDLPNRLFEKVLLAPARLPLDRPRPAGRAAGDTAGSVVEAAAFAAAPLAQVVVDPAGRLAMANVRAESLLGLRSRDVGRVFHELELSYRPVELRSLIDQVLADRTGTEVTEVEWHRVGDQDPTYLQVTVTPLAAPDSAPAGVAISFADISEQRRLRGELQDAHREIERAYEELQSTNEELETTNEELQSTIEELQTTNEELHSTNQELETMNQELTSTNDDLHSLNDTLRSRTDELNETSAFLQNVLSGLGKAVIVLDGELRVHAWSASAEELWGLRAEEVENADFLDLDMGLPVQRLATPLRQVLGAGEPRMAEVEVDAVNRRGRSMRLVVQLCQLHDGGTVNGAILLMNDAALDVARAR